jgi:hypothetical protein
VLLFVVGGVFRRSKVPLVTPTQAETPQNTAPKNANTKQNTTRRTQQAAVARERARERRQAYGGARLAAGLDVGVGEQDARLAQVHPPFLLCVCVVFLIM